MTVTTACSIEGKTIKHYLGIVSAATVLVLPGGNKSIQRGWETAVDSVLTILKQQAKALGADAIISIRFEPHGSNLCATGTAVKLD